MAWRMHCLRNNNRMAAQFEMNHRSRKQCLSASPGLDSFAQILLLLRSTCSASLPYICIHAKFLYGSRSGSPSNLVTFLHQELIVAFPDATYSLSCSTLLSL